MQKITCRISRQLSEPTRLDQALAQHDAVTKQNLTRGMIRKLILAGAVYVNGKRVKIASRNIRGGEVIDLYWDANRAPQKFEKNQFLPLRVLYEDEAVICFDKVASLPTQPTLDGARPNLFDLAKQQLQEKEKKQIYLGMHHRLDRDTSGVILFTRNDRYNSFIGDQFKNHTCSKMYVAVVHGKLKQSEGRLESFLDAVSKKGKQSRFGSVKAGGKKAITDYLVLATNGDFSLVEVKIPTGRTHQIRVHFSEMGHPIVGDTLYGSDEKYFNQIKRHLLHAHALTFTHPITLGVVRVESPVPQEFRKWVSSAR